MKTICMCGKEVNYEAPFDDFHTERVACGPNCRPTPQARRVAPEEHNRLSGMFPGVQLAARQIGMLGH